MKFKLKATWPRALVVALAGAALLAACDGRTERKTGESRGPNPASAHTLEVFPTAVSVKMAVRDSVSQTFAPARVTLSAGQLAQLRAALRSVQTPPPDELSACFVPHHRFDFFDASGTKVGEVLICFCCFAASSDPELVRQENRMLSADFKSLARLVTELGSSPKTNCDL